VGFANVSGLFTGGLLHDMGKLVLDVHLKQHYQDVRARVDEGSTFQEAEREVFGAEHAEIGARIAEHWAFPASLVDMIRWHHQPESSKEHVDACSLVHLADALAHWLGVGLGRPGLAVRFESSAVRRFGLSPEDLDRILIELIEKTQQTEQSLAA
jgi:putative nucleotidyltransferase with HDIG domain